jgi:acyl dehydratase
MPPVEIENLGLLKEWESHEFPATDWFVITQDRIQKFAEATNDQQWIHLDAERAARESPYRSCIAHGFMTLSLLSHLVRQAFKIRTGVAITVNYGLNKVRFPAAIRSGEAIRARVKVISVKEFVEFADVTFLVHLESNNSSKPCCAAEWLVRYYPQ